LPKSELESTFKKHRTSV